MLRVIFYQSIVIVAVAISFFAVGSSEAISSVFGGLIAIINTLLLARSIDNAGLAAYEQKKAKGAFVLIKGVVTRFALILFGFYLGIAHFELDALQMLVSFSLAQLGYVFYKTKNIY